MVAVPAATWAVKDRVPPTVPRSPRVFEPAAAVAAVAIVNVPPAVTPMLANVDEPLTEPTAAVPEKPRVDARLPVPSATTTALLAESVRVPLATDAVAPCVAVSALIRSRTSKTVSTDAS